MSICGSNTQHVDFEALCCNTASGTWASAMAGTWRIFLGHERGPLSAILLGVAGGTGIPQFLRSSRWLTHTEAAKINLGTPDDRTSARDDISESVSAHPPGGARARCTSSAARRAAEMTVSDLARVFEHESPLPHRDTGSAAMIRSDGTRARQGSREGNPDAGLGSNRNQRGTHPAMNTTPMPPKPMPC